MALKTNLRKAKDKYDEKHIPVKIPKKVRDEIVALIGEFGAPLKQVIYEMLLDGIKEIKRTGSFGHWWTVKKSVPLGTDRLPEIPIGTDMQVPTGTPKRPTGTQKKTKNQTNGSNKRIQAQPNKDDIIGKMKEMVDNGETHAKIAKWLNDKDIRTRKNLVWKSHNVERFLSERK